MAHARPKKSDPFGVRFDSEEQRLRFAEACDASGLAPAEALRIAAQAMVTAYSKFGRIPRDMEIRQAQIGDNSDMEDLLRRAVTLGEQAHAPYRIDKPPKDHNKSRPHGAGPDALVSDQPA